MEAHKEKLWTLPFVLDTVINLLVFLIYYLLIVIIAVVAKDTLHATSSQAGLAVGIYNYWYCSGPRFCRTLCKYLRESQSTLCRFGNLLNIYGVIFLYS